MTTVTLVFVLIGTVGVVLLALSLVVGDVIGINADGPFSVPSLAGSVGAFGFGGAIAAALVGNATLAVIAAALTGVFVAVPAGIGTIALSRAVERMRTDATPTRADLVGRLGVVVTPIPAQGYGEVRVSLGGQPVKLNARCDQPVALGAHVFVVEATSDTSVIVEETSKV
ncbi:MAG TPA: hypothetical protein VH561_14855 [Micromonosporaceae bacterium]|jgi:membrane protein implicated in regulation of membrane protease activity